KFLEQVKKEMNISQNIELSPHTLRRCFATYNAISGMPLPVLQKVLGHSKISTTALYIKDSDLSNLSNIPEIKRICEARGINYEITQGISKKEIYKKPNKPKITELQLKEAYQKLAKSKNYEKEMQLWDSLEEEDEVVVIPFTTTPMPNIPFHVPIEFVGKRGKILPEQIRSVDKKRVGSKIGELPEEVMLEIEEMLHLLFNFKN
ncbi:22874_t:CDS:2, partial [Gigaspora margarita]